MRQAIPLTLAVLALFMFALPAGATTVVRLDDGTLIDSAAKVVHGVVVEKTPHALPDGRRFYTEYRIRVSEMLKGEADEEDAEGVREVVFREWGARMPDGRGYWIPGCGSFEVGEEVLVFLGEPDPRTRIGFTTGLAQGKFHILREDGEAKATRKLGSSAEVTELGADGKPKEPEVEIRDLEALKRKVRERVSAKER